MCIFCYRNQFSSVHQAAPNATGLRCLRPSPPALGTRGPPDLAALKHLRQVSSRVQTLGTCFVFTKSRPLELRRTALRVSGHLWNINKHRLASKQTLL